MQLKNPIYLKLKDEPVSHTVDFHGTGQVMIDVAKDGSVLGIEILTDIISVKGEKGSTLAIPTDAEWCKLFIETDKMDLTPPAVKDFIVREKELEGKVRKHRR